MKVIVLIGLLFFSAPGVCISNSHCLPDVTVHHPPVRLYGNLKYTLSDAAIPLISEVRSLYQKAATDENSCNELIKILSPYNEENNPLYLGYKASGTMMMAKHAFNPFTKLSYFNRGKRMLEKAIEADEKNIELRFLRFAAQTHIPSFLGYHDRIATDKVFLLKSLPLLTDKALKEIVVSYLKKSDYLSDNEKQNITG